MNRTGVFATQEQADAIAKYHTAAVNTPMIAMSIAQGLSGNDLASQAWDNLHDEIDKCAKQNGLPDTVGHYGFDKSNSEFVTT